MKTRSPFQSAFRLVRMAALILPALVVAGLPAQTSTPAEPSAETAALLKKIEDMKTEINNLREEVATLRAAKAETPKPAAAAKAAEDKPAPPKTTETKAAETIKVPETKAPETKTEAKAKTPEPGTAAKPGEKPGTSDLVKDPSLVVSEMPKGVVRRMDDAGDKPAPKPAAGEAKPAGGNAVPEALLHDFRLPNGILMRLKGESWVSEQPFQNLTEVATLANGLNRSPSSPQVKDLAAAGYRFKAAMDGSLLFSR